MISITLDDYEQQYKVPVSQISDLAALESQLTPAFFTACLQDFITMRERWLQLINSIQHA